jgi:hypothetical protein
MTNITLRSVARAVIPRQVADYLRNLQTRVTRLESLEPTVAELRVSVSSLETAIDALIESPRYVAGDAGFNWQSGRKAIFVELLAAFPFDLVIETGTWTGNTTGYMAETSGLPVISAELSRRFHALARMRLADIPAITLINKDSRACFRDLVKDERVTNTFPFIYLDAHWYDDLPLRDEIELIATSWKQFVVMIDDFKVPDDPGYGYDDFGPGKVLCKEYIEPLLRAHGLVSFYPAMASVDETGLRRGCVVIAPNETGIKLGSLNSLRSLAT